jgi:hypothetical protein
VLEVAARPPFSGAVTLFETPWASVTPGARAEYDVSPDGERFVMIRPPDRSAVEDSRDPQLGGRAEAARPALTHLFNPGNQFNTTVITVRTRSRCTR